MNNPKAFDAAATGETDCTDYAVPSPDNRLGARPASFAEEAADLSVGTEVLLQDHEDGQPGTWDDWHEGPIVRSPQ